MVTGARLAWVAGAGALLVAGPLTGQGWDDSTTLALVRRGIDARQQAEPDSTLRSYHTVAHGFVFFLGQAGRELEAPPRLIKADELLVDVYWQAPDTHRQVVRGWRDGRWLPTDIHYHRDHLGIVTNNFGDRIRIGEGDEVRDVIHPLAPEGPESYEYRLTDSVRISTRDAVRSVYEVAVRPRDPARPRVIGTLSLDAASGDLIRFRFSFTPASYLDASVEDLSVTLENGIVEGRWWLPWRQEIEIRRRLTWLDLPARSIIRGRWEIGDYSLNAELPRAVRFGPMIGGLRQPAESSAAWPAPLPETIRDVARPVEERDLAALRDEVAALAGGGRLSGLARARLGISSVSDVARVNRVQGLALGVGLSLDLAPGLQFRPRGAIGTADGRITGDGQLRWRRGATDLTLRGGRAVADIADRPLASGVMRSLLAQEGGRDLGDYVRLDRLALGVTHRLSPSAVLRGEVGLEHSGSLVTEATPARGRYRDNPALGVGRVGVARLGLTVERARLDRDGAVRLDLGLEGGSGEREYARGTAELEVRGPAGPGVVAVRLLAGGGTPRLPPYRSFAIGGWGTLPGEDFRAFGGRRVALGWLEYRVQAPVPTIHLGPLFSTGNRVVIAPFLAAGVAGGSIGGMPWRATGELRPVAGVAVEWFHRLIRVETGVSLRTGQVGITVDVDREWWEIL